MPFKKYNSSNNAIAALNLPISDLDTTCVLKGNYGRFPTSNFIMKTTKTVGGVVTKRENIYVTTRTGATCTGLVRAYEPVPISDSAATNIQQALSFDADDVVEVVASSEFFKDMQDNLASKAGVQNQEHTYILDTGAANAYVATYTPAVTAYVAGLCVSFKAANANTSTSTINVNGLGVKTIKKYISGVSSNLDSGDIVVGQIVSLVYDGTNFQILSSTPLSIPAQSFILGESVTGGDALSLEMYYPALICDSQITFGNAAATQKIGFRLIGNGFGMTQLNVGLKKFGTPADNVTIDIYADSAGPTGSSLASGTYAGGSLTTSIANIVATISSITPTDKTPYWVVLGRSGANDASNYYQVGVHTDDTISFPYKINNAGVWGSNVLTETHSINGSGFYSEVAVKARANVFRFSKVHLFTPSSLSAYASVSKSNTKIYAGLSSLLPGKLYYLSNTAGAISTTPGTIVSTVGKAVNPSSIEIINSERIASLESISFTNTGPLYTVAKYLPEGGYVRMDTSGANGGNATATIQYSTDEGATWVDNPIAIGGSAGSGAWASSKIDAKFPAGWIRGKLSSSSNPNTATMTGNFYFFPY